MTMEEIITEVSFNLGLPTTQNNTEQQIETAVKIAFRELKRYMRTPTDKTVPFSHRIDLEKQGIKATRILSVFAAKPRTGLTLGSIDSGNVFQTAAAVNVYSQVGQNAAFNVNPIMTEMAMAQVRNTLSTDFQWNHDRNNNVILVAHREPMPSLITIRYVPDYTDVSEITNYAWLDYLIRMSEAYVKKSWGRARSKYKVESSNVSLDGEALLSEANAELEQIREELESGRNKFVILN